MAARGDPPAGMGGLEPRGGLGSCGFAFKQGEAGRACAGDRSDVCVRLILFKASSTVRISGTTICATADKWLPRSRIIARSAARPLIAGLSFSAPA